MAQLHPPLSLPGKVVGWGEEKDGGEGSHDPSLLPEVQGPVASPGRSGPAD